MRGAERPSAPVRLSALMADVLKRSALPKRKEMSGLDAAWVHAAGPEVARRSRPVGLKGGELTVAFESAALRQEVECFRKAEILARLAAAWTESRIAKLKCVVRRG